MRSTRLADLFYRWGLNPFFVVIPLMFLVPLCSFLFLSALIGMILLLAFAITIVVCMVCGVLFYVYFHRNPPRDISFDDSVLLSPADGHIVYIKEIQQGTIVESVKHNNRMRLTELLDITDADALKTGSSTATGYLIGIELRMFDVHITRAPMSGTKLFDHHVSGRIVTMHNPDFEYINDRETVVVRQERDTQHHLVQPLQIAVVQIATFITRTIQSYVREKTQIKQGEPMGKIRLGSQVDLVIFSTDVTLLVKEHDRVYAGVTKIAEIHAS